MLPIVAIILWLSVNYITGWLPFYSLLCVFASLFLIMPSLLKFDIKDFSLLKKYKELTFLNIGINFIFVPLTFFLLWKFVFSEIYISYAFLLLGFLSGGGMLLHWIGRYQGDKKLGFLFFMLNIFIFSLVVFYPLNTLIQGEGSRYSLVFIKTWGGYNCVFGALTGWYVSCVTQGGQISPLFSLLVLTIFPFFLSRLIRFIKPINRFLENKIQTISQGAIFAVIFYIFSLKQLHSVFSLSAVFLLQVLFTLAIGYIVVYLSLYALYVFLWKKKEHMALFWIGATRFITLGFVFSFVYSTFFWVKFLVIFVMAYFIQIFFSLGMKFFFSIKSEK